MSAFRICSVLLTAAMLLSGQQKQANQQRRDQLFERLERMTPEERESALSKLPPAQRANIEKRIRNFQNLPPAAQERRLEQLQRLESLPPKEQAQVRRSMNQRNKLPDDRKMAINRELRNMNGMTDDERQAYMSTEQFRNRYSASEQEIVGNIAKILPKNQ
jgi:Protein of unknown function (DUF3106)